MTGLGACPELSSQISMAGLAVVTAENLVCQGENPVSEDHGGVSSQGTSISWHAGNIWLLLQQNTVTHQNKHGFWSWACFLFLPWFC